MGRYMRESEKQIQLKHINRRSVLKYMRRNENVTKAELAQVTGLTFMAIKKIMEELKSLSLIRTHCIEETTGVGRRAMSYRINENYGYVIGVHINRFVTSAAVMNLRGEISTFTKRKMTIELQDQEALVEMLVTMIEEVLVESKIDKNKVLGIGVGAPGPINRKEGIVLSPPNFQSLSFLPISDVLTERTGLPVLLQKDTNAIALGEYWNGAGKGGSNLIYVELDIGIGNGIVCEGKVENGYNQMAGELGHITMEMNGPMCSCGNKGCLEVLSGGLAIVEQVKNRLSEQKEHPLYKKMETLTIEDVLLAAENHDVLVLAVLNKAAEYTGVAISNLIKIFDPQMIVLGGILIRKNQRYMEAICNSVASRSMKGHTKYQIVSSALEKKAGVVGAGIIVIDHFFETSVNEVLKKEEH